MQWNALNATGICPSSSAHRRFQEWEQAGLFHEIWRQGLLDYDAEVGIDWSWLAADGAMTKAPLGGAKTGPNPTDRAKRGEALAPCRGCRRHGRDLPRGRQSPRRKALGTNFRVGSDRPADPRGGPSTGALSGPRLRLLRDSPTRHHPALRAPHPNSRRRDRAEDTPPRMGGAPLGGRGGPLTAQSQPRNPHPLVQERGEPPRPAATGQWVGRLQEGVRGAGRSGSTGIGP